MFIITDAIVLRKIKVSDYDKILTLFTKKTGKISVSVRGGQNPKSKMASGSHPFVFGEFSINKSGRISSVNYIDVKNSFYKLREDLDKLTIASYFLELVSVVTVENVTNNILFELLLDFLSKMEKSKNVKEYYLLKIVFELKLLNFIGLRPEMNNCVNCGTDDIQNAKFSVADGGIVCENCSFKFENSYKIGSVIPKLIVFLMDYSIDEILSIEIDDILVKKVDFLLNEFLLYHLERKGFKSLKYF